jgi:iron-sulfur cluster repair protein YtfE (RIC family)
MDVKITELLMGEHGVFYAMFEHMAKTTPSAGLDEIKSSAALLIAALASHAHLEDDAVFRSLEPFLGTQGGPLAVMRMEHDEIEGTLLRIPGVTEVEEARRMTFHVIEVARSHFAKEERILFPMAEEHLGAKKLEELSAKWAEVRLTGEQPFCS